MDDELARITGWDVRPDVTFGEPDDYSYNAASDPGQVHDWHATLVHCVGIGHMWLTFKFQGRHHRLTDVHGEVVKGILG